MVRLSKIVKELRETYGMEVIARNNELSIEQLLFWQSEDGGEFQATLYLAEYQDDFPKRFKKPVLFVNAPCDVKADNCIYITSKQNLLSVYNIVQEILYHQLSANLKKEELFESLQTGAGIEALAKIAFSYFNNPIAICDTSFTVLLQIPDNEATDDIVEENGRYFVKDMSIDSMRSEKVIDKLFHARAPFVEKRTKYEYEWLYSNIRINEAVVGYICIRSKNQPFTETDIDFSAVFAKTLSIEMQKSEFFMQKTGLRYEYFLNDLLNGRFSDEETIRKRATHLGRTLDQYFWMIIFFHEKGSRMRMHITSGYFVEQMHAIFPNGMTVFCQGMPVLLLSRNNPEPFQPVQIKKLNDFLQFNRMNCAVSYCFTNIMETPYYFNQVQTCDMLYAFENTRIVQYEDVAMQHLLQLATKDLPLISFIHPKVRALLKYDKQHKTMFAKTLRCYLANGRNITKTALELGIHKSTLSYRIGKIAEIAQLSTEGEKDYFLLELSFRVYDYLEHGK